MPSRTIAPRALAAALSCAICNIVAAQSSSSSDVLEDVVVTAERRSENVQTTPIALSVLSGKDLEKNSVFQVDQLQNTTPALSVSDNGSTKYVNIRGVGLGVSAPGVANGVAYFVDGLFLLDAPLYQDDPYFDLARVEVLRGPQGTLVGEGSTGGAIYVVSQKPVLGATQGSIEQTFGNYGEYKTLGVLNLPFGANWAGRVAFEIEKRDSFYHLIAPPAPLASDPNQPGTLFRAAARVGIEGQITDALELTLRSELQHRTSGGLAGKPIPGDPVDTAFLGASPPRPFDLSFDFPTRDDALETENSVELNWKINSEVALRSLTGFTTGERHFAQDTDGSYIPGDTRMSDIGEHNYSQEFNLVSTGDHAYKWVVGLFELFQTLEGTNRIDVLTPPFSPAMPSTTLAVGNFSTNSLGLFGQTSFDFTQKLQLVVGARYSIDDTKDLSGGYTNQDGHTHPSQGSEKNHAVTGKVTLNYQLTPDEFLFGTVARGYKAGGFNDATSKFLPEYVIDYETGLKSTFLDGRVRTQLGAFYYDYKSIQVPVYDTMLAFTNVGNGGAAQVDGAEAQIEARFGGFGIDGNGSYTHAHLGGFDLIDPRLLPFQGTVPLCGFGPGPCTFNFQPYMVNLRGKSLPFAPPWTAHLGVDYTFTSGDNTLIPRLGVSYLGAQYATTYEDPEDRIPSRFLVDGMVTYRYGKAWHGEVYANNLLNRAYISGKFDDLQYYGAPRQFGIRVGYAF